MTGPLLLGILIGYSVGIAVIVAAAIPDTWRGIWMARFLSATKRRLGG